MSHYNFNKEDLTIASDFSSQVKGRTFLITGPSTGSVGAETALNLARGYPSTLLLLVLSLPKIQPVIDIIDTISPSTGVKSVPLTSLASIRAAAKAIFNDTSNPHIVILINNAGIMACPYERTEVELESQWQTNSLSHFLLTNLLFPNLLLSPNPPITNASTVAYLASDILYNDPGFFNGEIIQPHLSARTIENGKYHLLR